MGLFSGCLLASDIDGTIESNGIISPRTIEKIAYFISEGGKFSLSTGRTAPAVKDVLSKVDNIAPSVLANGAVIYDFCENRVLWEASVPKEDLELALEVYKSRPEMGIELHTAHQVVNLRSNNEIRDHAFYEHLEPLPISPDELYGKRFNKILYASDNPAELNKLRDFVNISVHNSVFRDTSAQLGGRKRSYLEQLPGKASKGSGCRKLIELLGIEKGGYFAIGDYYNDLDMILDSDIGCFTADAPEELQKQADFVAGFASEGAVADFIDYLANLRS